MFWYLVIVVTIIPQYSVSHHKLLTNKTQLTINSGVLTACCSVLVCIISCILKCVLIWSIVCYLVPDNIVIKQRRNKLQQDKKVFLTNQRQGHMDGV